MVIAFSLFVCGHFVVPVALFRKVPPFFVLQYQIKRDMPFPVAEVHVQCLTFLGFFWKKAHHERVVIVVYIGVQALTALLLNFCWRGLLFGGVIFCSAATSTLLLVECRVGCSWMARGWITKSSAFSATCFAVTDLYPIFCSRNLATFTENSENSFSGHARCIKVIAHNV